MARLVGVGLALLALAAASAFAAEPDAPTRREYVLRLEVVCKPGSEATRRAVRGIRGDLRAERLRVAAAKFARARTIFSRTITSISRVRRPPDDEPTLERWFAALAREEAYLGRMVSTLRADDLARFQRVSADFIHQGNKANNIVVSYGFDYCAFRPSRFQ